MGSSEIIWDDLWDDFGSPGRGVWEGTSEEIALGGALGEALAGLWDEIPRLRRLWRLWVLQGPRGSGEVHFS